MISDFFNKYEYIMQNLSVKTTKGIKAPHKAIMLISIFEALCSGEIKENRIYLDDNIADRFKRYWTKYITGKIVFEHYVCSPWTPFWHLKNESFWHFCEKDNSMGLDNIVAKGQTASIGKMRDNVLFAYIDEELYYLLKNPSCCKKICTTLIETYINDI